MYSPSVRPRRTETSASSLPRLPYALLIALLFAQGARGQQVRPIDPGIGLPINPGGGGVIGGGGGIGGGGIGGGGINIGGGGVIIGGGGLLPINPIFPIPGGGATVLGPQIVTENGMLTGQTLSATVVVPDEPATAAAAQQPGTTVPASTTTYQWSISGGRITSDPTKESIRYTADAPGSVTLNVVILSRGSGQNASAQVTVLSPTLAGTVTSPPTARSSATSLTASVPAAQNGDRTFRWSVNGSGAAIMAGQGTNTVTLRPGAPGLLEVVCDVTLQRLATATVRSFVVVTGDGPPVALTVNRGDGGGTYPAGSRVDIFAEPPSAGEVFDKWIGATAMLGDAPLAAFSPHAMVTVPAAPATLTATYRTVAQWTPTTVTGFNPVPGTSPGGTTLVYHIPPDAKGVVFLLHNSGGTAAGWFNSPEQLTLARALVAAGYGVAAVNSANRVTGEWSVQPLLASNPDAATLGAALNRFAGESLAANTPVFLLGVGNGGDAAARFAQLLATASPARPIRGAVVYCAASTATGAVTSRVPQLFALAAHDETLGASGTAEARENSQLLAGRGIPTAVVTNGTSPIPAGRLRALGVNADTFTAADAQAIWTALKTAGILDANNYPKSVPTLDAVRAALPAALKPRASDVVAQLGVAFGAQEFFSDANAQVIAFLDARVAAEPARDPGRLANVSARTAIAYLGDTFTLGFTLTGTQRATLLIRGVGPSLSRFGVADPLSAPRLTVTRGSTLIASNESWDTDARSAEVASAAAAVGAFPLPRGSLDTAVLVTLDPGAYAATITSINGAVGGVLAEVYDVSRNVTRLTNVSTLAKIGADGEPLFPAIVVAGNTPRTLVVRAIGPGLADLGLPANTLLGDPRITVLNRAGQVIAANNNWTQTGAGNDATMLTAVFSAAGAFPLKATNADAALVTAFAPGSYVLQTAAAPIAAPPLALLPPAVSTTGAVLVEVFEVP